MFAEIPAIPCPSMTTPINSKGSAPASMNTADWPMPAKIPKAKRIKKVIQNPTAPPMCAVSGIRMRMIP